MSIQRSRRCRPAASAGSGLPQIASAIRRGYSYHSSIYNRYTLRYNDGAIMTDLTMRHAGCEPACARGWSKLCSIAGLLLCLTAGGAAAQTTESKTPVEANWRVRLLAPLSTKFSRKGDMVSAEVIAP